MKICAHPDCSNEVTNPKATFCSRKCQGSRSRYAGAAPAAVETSVEIDRVHPADDNVRVELTDLDGLADSIREVGILQPLLLQPHPSIDGHYRIIAGHRRHAAARLAGLTHVPFVSYTITVNEHASEVMRVLAMAAENLQRVDLSVIEEARTFDRLRTAGLSQRKIAAAVGKTQAHVSRRLSLLELPERAQQLVDTGRITLEEGVELGRLTADELTELLDDPNVDWDNRWQAELKIERVLERSAARRVIAGWKVLARDAGIEILDTNPGWNHKGLDARSLSASTTGASDVFLEYLNADRAPVCCAFTDTQVMLYLPRVTREHPAPSTPPAGPDEAPEAADNDERDADEDLTEFMGPTTAPAPATAVRAIPEDPEDLSDVWSERHLQQAIVDLYDFIVTQLDSSPAPISSYLIDPLVAAAARASLEALDYPDRAAGDDVDEPIALVPTGARAGLDDPLPWHTAKLDDFRVQAQFNHNPESLKRIRAEVVEHGHAQLEQVLEIIDDALNALEPTLFNVDGGAS